MKEENREACVNMKKMIIALSLLLVLAGCSSSDEEKETTPASDPKPTEKTSLKTDEAKDYLYISASENIALNDDQKQYVKDGQDVIDTVVVNINSEDAKTLTQTLDKEAEELKSKIIKNEDGSIQQFTSMTATAIESSRYVTILVTKQPFIWQSEAVSATYDVYIFSKDGGALMTQEEMMKAEGMDDAGVLANIKSYYEANDLKICEMPGDCYYEPKIYHNDENVKDTVMYLNDKDQLVVYVQKSFGLGYEWVPLILAK